MEEPLYTITRQEYKSLLHDRKILRALEAAGVDNWEGWENLPHELFDEQE